MHSISLKNNRFFRYVSTILLVTSVVYLVYEITRFDGYDDLLTAFKKSSGYNLLWLIAVLMLLPVNWLVEALKWKKVCCYKEKQNLNTACKAILSGISSGFVTPNRLGDIVGRMHFLQAENRESAVSLAAVNSLTQNLAILLPGIPLAILFFIQHQQSTIQPGTYIFFLVIILLLFSVMLFALPVIARRFKNPKFQAYFSSLTNYTLRDLVVITGWSLLRFLVFSLQLFLMLQFFGVDLTITQAITSIPVTYLLVTFTPSFAFSEALIRGSWAIFVIGQFAPNTPGILLAGVGLWFINVIIPVIAGNILILKLRLGKARF
ncbi:MAG: lysylphosphatidylglycerol synthase domain-containing protein [Paludibacter sp.]|nr:lysylphosphatidylglycerol synthase domain-containing protein [Paludibacter sp.]MDD4197838.1 lysylphosphatidylglycerol synthase domain-containing protein [Paludibacter sp.]MDD4427881.1 lysylphosphatidylglycerol synthase domain-containing protein [Paludibacter sp.]